jgi:hypothetical protein
LVWSSSPLWTWTLQPFPSLPTDRAGPGPPPQRSGGEEPASVGRRVLVTPYESLIHETNTLRDTLRASHQTFFLFFLFSLSLLSTLSLSTLSLYSLSLSLSLSRKGC